MRAMSSRRWARAALRVMGDGMWESETADSETAQVGPQLAEELAPLLGRHPLHFGGRLGAKAIQRAAHPLLGLWRELVDPGIRPAPGTSGRRWTAPGLARRWR